VKRERWEKGDGRWEEKGEILSEGKTDRAIRGKEKGEAKVGRKKGRGEVREGNGLSYSLPSFLFFLTPTPSLFSPSLFLPPSPFHSVPRTLFLLSIFHYFSWPSTLLFPTFTLP